MVDEASRQTQRVVVHARRGMGHAMPYGQVIHYEDGVLRDVMGCTYERKNREEWERDAPPEHQPKDRRSRRD